MSKLTKDIRCLIFLTFLLQVGKKIDDYIDTDLRSIDKSGENELLILFEDSEGSKMIFSTVKEDISKIIIWL